MKKIYARPNESTQYIDHTTLGAVLMNKLRPTDNHYICEDQGDDTGVWILDITTIEETARVEAHTTEYADLKGKTLDEKLDWAKDRMNETTLDGQTKTALGKIFKKLIAVSSRKD